MTFVRPTVFKGRQGVCIGNDCVELAVLTGGGHIAYIRDPRANEEESGDFRSPLWIPPWPTHDPAVAEAVDPDVFGTELEGKYLLSHIMGHNLCLDVFGAHSKGEVGESGLAFHGEAGKATWCIDAVNRGEDSSSMTLRARLPESMLEVSRTFTVRAGRPVVKVEETMKSLVGFERALGRAEHVTIGKAFLRKGRTVFHCNADRGRTHRERLGACDAYATDVDFQYPDIPAGEGNLEGEARDKRPKCTRDWRRYPHEALPKSQALLTMRVNPNDRWGWFSAHNLAWESRLVYVWDRQEFPWIVTWEENMCNEAKPWAGRTLTRGLEFSSYAFPTCRRENVKMGSLFDTPTFQWLDAHETRTTTFFVEFKPMAEAEARPPTAAELSEIVA